MDRSQARSDQHDHYARLVEQRRPTRHLFSCGYHERFDPFLLDERPFLVPVYERIFSSFFPTPVGSLLDVGCGTGLYWPVLKRYCSRLVGVDLSEAMIAEASRLIQTKGLRDIEAKVHAGEDLDFPPSTFDAIVVMDGLHHIAGIEEAIDSFHRVLKPGGRFCAVEPNTLNPLIFLAHLVPPEERRALSRNYAPTLRRLFRARFKNVQIEYVNYVMSAASAQQLRRVEQLGRLMSRTAFLRPFSLRQLITMTRRDD
jgi:ubiquinone/menaquinone biosynthesis C-methylase UbiE